MKLSAIWRLVRPKQFAKNLVALAAMLFTLGSAGSNAPSQAAIAVLCLCLAGASIYCLNDILDVERDRLHPKKSKRPIASGEVSISSAIGIAAVSLLGSLGLAGMISTQMLLSVIVFLGIQLFYNFYAKSVAILDVIVIALAFVQRAIVGAVAISVDVSGWLLFCTAMLALLMGFGKRRSELQLQSQSGIETRPALQHYTPQLADHLLVMSASMASLAYGIYAIESSTAQAHPGIIFTFPFVLFAVMRYLQLAFVGSQDAGEPESLFFTDKPLILSVIGFGIVAAIAMFDRLPTGFLMR